MARGSSGIVAGLTAAALAVVGVLAYQASANAPASVAAPDPKASAPVTAPAKPKKKEPEAPAAVPTNSGTGKRTVYALGDRRVWLVDENEKVLRTFEVVPSALSPAPGTYLVSSRGEEPTKGSDGVMIEHVVRFALVDGVTVGFSSAVDGSMKAPDPSLKTGGVRMSRADGNALWNFAWNRTSVVVVP